MDAQQFEDPRIESGLGWLVVGSSGSGKTQFVKNLLLNQEKIFKKPFTCIYYITAFYQDHFKELEDKLNVRFFTSWDHDELRSPESCLGGCWIIDDMAHKLEDKKFLLNQYLVNNHHCDLTTITLLHHWFSKQIPHLREINLNSAVNVLLSSPRSTDAIANWARQVFGRQGTKFMALYKRLCEGIPYNHIMVYLAPRNPPILRIRSNIFEIGGPTEIYVLDEK